MQARHMSPNSESQALHKNKANAYQFHMSGITKTIALRNDQETRDFGAKLAKILRAGDVVCLRGELGAGKTSLARGAIESLCDVDEVPSPTYTLVQTYSAPTFDIWHFDLYRLEEPGDVWELGIEEALDDGVCLIEWPERIEGLLSGTELNIVITFTDDGREALVSGASSWEGRLDEL